MTESSVKPFPCLPATYSTSAPVGLGPCVIAVRVVRLTLSNSLSPSMSYTARKSPSLFESWKTSGVSSLPAGMKQGGCRSMR